MAFQVAHFKGSSGRFYISNSVINPRCTWVNLARILGVSADEFIEKLINDYHATVGSYTRKNNFLYFYWENEVDCKKFKSDINKIAKKGNWIF